MSRTFHLSSIASSILSNDFFPPIELDVNKQYGLGLIAFYAYHSIKNITSKNNIICLEVVDPEKFWADVVQREKSWAEEGSAPKKINVRVAPGAYEIDEINKFVQKAIYDYLYPDTKTILNQGELDDMFKLSANNNTLKCEISSKFIINFDCDNSIASLLGFGNSKCPPRPQAYVSTRPINIMNLHLVQLDCNIISGSYINGKEAHTLFSFDIDVEPGYKLTKEPHNIIYLPVIPAGRQYLDNITIRVVDDNGELIDFGEETINITLELKEIN